MTWLRYVPLDAVGPYLAIGWTIADDMANTHHGFHAVLMRWEGQDEPR